ncbi:MAG: cysteine--tRNA ligase [Christensenellaceae bacterium]
MKIYNTMTREKEEFIPLQEGYVGIYACGPTVYNFFHIGNARPIIVFDTLCRYFEYRGYNVNFVQNFTDIDDKMIRAAEEEGITVKELADRYIKEYFVDAKSLNVKPATVHPKATEHITEILSLIDCLMQKGHAYQGESGDVYYDTASFPDYGKLSGQDLEDLEMGARIDINDEKKNPMDFVLWKMKKEGEPYWESPYGAGRPGWHIECSAMSQNYLGETFDIHGGGQDLTFPHHENEIAQSEGCSGKEFARYWMHNAYVNINHRKMSKSTGNFFTVRDLSREYDMFAVRLFMLSAQYRSPINFSTDLIEQSETALRRIETCLSNLEYVIELGEAHNKAAIDLETYRKDFIAAMDDDLNTADALSVIFDLVREANTVFTDENLPDAALAAQTKACMEELLDVLGLARAREEEIPEEIYALVEQRTQARAEKNWARADELRDIILEKGYELKDGANGVQIEKV